MAGTLTISTLSDGTNSTSATNCIQGSAKAWANWGGTGTTINASYNVSSITRSTTGNYVVNFTNALSDTNYTVVQASTNMGTSAGNFVTTGTPIVPGYLTSNKATTSVNILNLYGPGGTAFDNNQQGVVIFR